MGESHHGSLNVIFFSLNCLFHLRILGFGVSLIKRESSPPFIHCGMIGESHQDLINVISFCLGVFDFDLQCNICVINRVSLIK